MTINPAKNITKFFTEGTPDPANQSAQRVGQSNKYTPIGLSNRINLSQRLETFSTVTSAEGLIELSVLV
jgi:hypothetical protein